MRALHKTCLSALISASLGVSAHAEDVLRVWFVYRDAQVQKYGVAELDRFAIDSVEYANQAFANSGLDVRVELAGRDIEGEDFAASTKDPDIEGTFDVLKGEKRWFDNHERLIGNPPKGIMIDYQVDVLAGIGNRSSDVCGLANLEKSLNKTRVEDFAYAPSVLAISKDCSNGRGKTIFAHELGHVLGANHEAGDEATPSYSVSYQCAGKGTIMKATAYDTELHLFYSDPNHIVNGEPCGEQDVADAVRGFRQTIPVVANRIGDWQPVGDFVLDVPAQVNEGETVTITITRTGQTDSAQTVELVSLLARGMNDSDVQGLDARTKVTFAEGETQKTVTFAIAQDDVHEPNDEIQFWLANTGNYRGSFVPTVLMIHDDDEQSSGGGNNNTGNTGGSSGGGGGAAWWLTLLAFAVKCRHRSRLLALMRQCGTSCYRSGCRDMR